MLAEEQNDQRYVGDASKIIYVEQIALANARRTSSSARPLARFEERATSLKSSGLG